MKANKRRRLLQYILHIDKFLPTQDDWFPNHPRNTVKISLHEWQYSDATFELAVSVSGADDFSLRKEFLKVNQCDVDLVLKCLKSEVENFPNPLNKDWLISKQYKLS